MLALGIIGIVLSLFGLLTFIATVSGFNEGDDATIQVWITIAGAVCFYLSTVLF